MSEWRELEWAKRPKRRNEAGYIEIYYPELPNGSKGWQLEHRLIYSNYVRHFLEPEAVVHHVDEIKDHNYIENLYLCDNEEHALIHKTGKTHTNETKIQMSKSHQKIMRTRDSRGRYGPVKNFSKTEKTKNDEL